MRLVVDASVAVEWVLKEPDSGAARRVVEQAELLAPGLLWAEFGQRIMAPSAPGRAQPFECP
jgi:predicted nucleic acid-binding protein